MDDWKELAEWWLGEADNPDYHEEVIPLLFEVLQPVQNQVLLDLGCGDGRVQGLVAAQGPKVIGVDINIHLARIASRDHPVVLNRLPSLDCVGSLTVDGAYVVLTLEHLDDSRLFFEETARVVRPGGLLAVVINHPVYTSPGAGPVIDTTDGELLWRFGRYLRVGSTHQPASGVTVEFVHRPIGLLLTEAAEAGWRLELVSERGVGTAAAARDPILARHGDIPHLMALRWQRI